MEALRPQQLETASVLPDGTAALRGEVQEIATGLDSAFNEAGTRLGETTEMVTAVIDALQEVAHVFDGGEAVAATNSLTASANRLAQVANVVRQRGDLVERIRQVSGVLRRNVDDVQRCLRALHIYGMNVKIAASGEPDFVDFADQMSVKLKTADSETKGFESTLVALEASLARMQANDARLMRECARVIPQVPDRLIRDADALRAHQDGLAHLASSTMDLTRSVQSELGEALVAIQVGDRARQRLEHVITGATLLEARCGAGEAQSDENTSMRAHVQGLLSALTEDVAGEFARDARALASALMRLRSNAKGVVALQEQGGDDDEGTMFLRRIEDGIAQAADMIEHLQSADEQAAETLDVIIATVGDVSARVGAIRTLRIDVRQMAINIGLRCRKVERIGRPVAVIANEIRAHSGTLDTIIGTVNAAEADLVTISEGMRQQAEDHERFGSGDLGQALETIHDCAQASEMAMATVEQGTATTMLLLEQACSLLDEALENVPRIEAAAEGFAASRDADAPAPEGEQHPVRALLDDIARTYTMASERAVHNHFVLPGMEALSEGSGASHASASAPDDDSFDDFDGFDDFDDELF